MKYEKCDEEEKEKNYYIPLTEPKPCKWYENGCTLHPLSDNTPSTCSHTDQYPCKTLLEQREEEKIENI